VGDTVSSPRIAAAKACYAAAIEYPRKRGTILVAADDAADARSCVQFLSSFFADQDALRALLKAQKGDTFELAGGKRITVTTDRTRRPSGRLACIRLTSAASEPANPRDVARACILAARAEPGCAARIESLLGLEPGWFAARREFHRKKMLEWTPSDAGLGVGLKPASSKPETSVPSVPRPPGATATTARNGNCKTWRAGRWAVGGGLPFIAHHQSGMAVAWSGNDGLGPLAAAFLFSLRAGPVRIIQHRKVCGYGDCSEDG